jgi:hypothetical protein
MTALKSAAGKSLNCGITGKLQSVSNVSRPLPLKVAGAKRPRREVARET